MSSKTSKIINEELARLASQPATAVLNEHAAAGEPYPVQAASRAQELTHALLVDVDQNERVVIAMDEDNPRGGPPSLNGCSWTSESVGRLQESFGEVLKHVDAKITVLHNELTGQITTLHTMLKATTGQANTMAAQIASISGTTADTKTALDALEKNVSGALDIIVNKVIPGAKKEVDGIAKNVLNLNSSVGEVRKELRAMAHKMGVEAVKPSDDDYHEFNVTLPQLPSGVNVIVEVRDEKDELLTAYKPGAERHLKVVGKKGQKRTFVLLADGKVIQKIPVTAE